jgi:hypothetical protein
MTVQDAPKVCTVTVLWFSARILKRWRAREQDRKNNINVTIYAVLRAK